MKLLVQIKLLVLPVPKSPKMTKPFVRLLIQGTWDPVFKEVLFQTSGLSTINY
jgi:hypothetical protein